MLALYVCAMVGRQAGGWLMLRMCVLCSEH